MRGRFVSCCIISVEQSPCCDRVCLSLREKETDLGFVHSNQPAGPLVRTVDQVPLWQEPWILGRIPLVGPVLNVLYNWMQQKLTYKSVGEFLSDNLGPGDEMRGKRVGLLEDLSAGKK